MKESTSQVASYYEHMRTDICELVARYAPAPRGRVLDIGCATGRLGEALKMQGLAGVVDGIELSEAAAHEARSKLDRVWAGDLATFDLGKMASGYDVVIAADVLEHLPDPWTTLRGVHRLLHPEGKLVASIPTVRYWKVLADLVVGGDFRYADAGVLDRTHLRFFTRKSIERLLLETGFEMEYLGPKPSGRKGLRRILMSALGEFGHVQYHVVARPRVRES